jgi:alpha-glucosidase
MPSSESVLAFERGARFACIVNFGPDPVELPVGADVLIASDELEGGELPRHTTVWLRQAEDPDPSSDTQPGQHDPIG